MIFADLVAGEAIFLDANTLVYHFSQHVAFGSACSALLRRIERGEVTAYTSSHVLSEVCHKLMTPEACSVNNWVPAGVANRLKRHPAAVQQLVHFQQAMSRIPQSGIQVLPLSLLQIVAGAALSRQLG